MPKKIIKKASQSFYILGKFYQWETFPVTRELRKLNIAIRTNKGDLVENQ
jgi:hypothetical protein